MAQRFGGEFSPQDSPNTTESAEINKFRGRKAHKTNFRSKLLFLAPLPLLLSGIGEMQDGDAAGMVAEFGALSMLLLAPLLLREGLSAQAAYEARKVARPPMFPRKIFAAILTGLGVFLAAFGGWHQDIAVSLVYGMLATGAFLISFGVDPLKSKGIAGVDAFASERVAKAVDKAEDLLAQTLRAAENIGDRKLEGRVEQLASAARDMFRAVEQDPRDLTLSRKFMSVYLRGARDATEKFAILYSQKHDPNIRADYVALLDDLETSFAAQREKMLLDDRSDLDVEIEVLRDRLQQHSHAIKYK